MSHSRLLPPALSRRLTGSRARPACTDSRPRGDLLEPAIADTLARYRARMTGTNDFAADLGLDKGDVRVLLRQLGEQTPDMPDELVAFLRQMFDPNGERTALPSFYWPGTEDEPPRVYGLGGPDPTAP